MKYLKILFVLSILNTNCASILCKNDYVAKVHVINCPDDAKIYIGKKGLDSIKNNQYIKINRTDINRVSFTVKPQNKKCAEQTFEFIQLDSRIPPLIASLVCDLTLTLLFEIPIPAFTYTDIYYTGAIFKPSIKEPGVQQLNNDYYIYHLKYSGCDEKPQ